MSSNVAAFQQMAQEFYPGSARPIMRHPNRSENEVYRPSAEWDAAPKILKVNGVDTEFFTVGQLAMALGGRKPVTIRKWERTGVIPKSTFRKPSDDPRGQRRLYTRAQVEGLVKIAKEEGVLETHAKPITRTNFTARAIELFRALAAKEGL